MYIYIFIYIYIYIYTYIHTHIHTYIHIFIFKGSISFNEKYIAIVIDSDNIGIFNFQDVMNSNGNISYITPKYKLPVSVQNIIKNKCNGLNNRDNKSNYNDNSNIMKNDSSYKDINDTTNKDINEPYLRVRSSPTISDNNQNFSKITGKRDGMVRDFAWSPCNVHGGIYIHM
jgi:hypothetical protein